VCVPRTRKGTAAPPPVYLLGCSRLPKLEVLGLRFWQSKQRHRDYCCNYLLFKAVLPGFLLFRHSVHNKFTWLRDKRGDQVTKVHQNRTEDGGLGYYRRNFCRPVVKLIDS